MNRFDAFLDQIKDDLPFEAEKFLPMLFSDEMKQRIVDYDSDKVVKAIKASIVEIESGSNECLETLVKKYLCMR